MRVFYFSGTGNSLYAARRIAGDGDDAQITSIAEYLRGAERAVSDREIVIVCPVYFYGVPPVVERFIAEARFEDVSYLSAVFTAEFPNGLALAQVTSLFEAKGLAPDSLFYVKMPTNYAIKSKMLSATQIDKVLAAADKKIAGIAEAISQRSDVKEHDSRLYSLIVGAKASSERWARDFPTFDSAFRVTSACNGCGTCAAGCPFANIAIEGEPRWLGHCEACLRCLNTCPRRAIEYGDSTVGRDRYLNPRIALRELTGR